MARPRWTLGVAAWLLAVAAWAQPLPGATELPLRLVRLGDIGGLLLVEAQLAGESTHWLLDTGASSHVVERSLSQRLGLRAVGSSSVSSIGGTQALRRVELPPLQVGPQALSGQQAIEADLRAYFGRAGLQVDGILGMPFFAGRRAVFDLPQRRLTLGGSPAPAAPGREMIIPMRLEGGLPVIQLALGGRPAEGFLFDTGNPGALVLFARRAERPLFAAGTPPPPELRVQEFGGEVRARYVVFQRVAGGTFQRARVPAAIESGARARRGGHFDSLSGSAGTALFEHMVVTLDAAGGSLRVASPPAPPDIPGGFGLSLVRQGEALVVDSVMLDSPAAQAGVAPGDRLVSLDGRPAPAEPAAVWDQLADRQAAEFGFERATLRLERRVFFPAVE